MRALCASGWAWVLAAAWSAAAPVDAPSLARLNRRTPVVEAVQKVLPSVVNIGTERVAQQMYTDPIQRARGELFEQFFRDFFGAPPGGSAPPDAQQSLGSGVIIDPSGYILTNFHVIERATRINVMMADQTVAEGRFIAGDPISDLALIKVDANRPLPAVTMAEDDDLLLGEWVVALGNPFGLSQTVTLGVLSGLNREARHRGQVLFRDILQTDAAVNPGNSGGPLVNINGDLIGINVAVHQEAQNIGFAVPVKRVRALAGAWLSPRQIRKEWLGFDVAATDGVPRVSRLDPASAAARQGVREGDAIRSLNGRPVPSLFDLHQRLLPAREGEKLTLGLDGGRTLEAALAPVPRPQGDLLARRALGLVFDLEAKAPGGAERQGLLVKEVEEGTPLFELGLRPGMVVTQINGTGVRTLDDVGLALENVRSQDQLAVSLMNVTQREGFIIAQNYRAQVAAR